MIKDFKLNLKTPEAEFCREEQNKANSNGIVGDLPVELRDLTEPDLKWEAEQLAKSYGIYLEFDRAKTGSERDWIYMIRVTIPGGGPIPPAAWQLFDQISEQFAIPNDTHGPSLRLTTRQNVQFHWIRKADLLTVVRRISESGYTTLNGCGDNTRNVMACPLSRFSDVFDANKWAHKVSHYFAVPSAPFIQIFEVDPNYVRNDEEEKFKYGTNLLNRKFKIAFSTVHRDRETGELVADNCVELRTNDVGIAPVFLGERLQGFQIFAGGGQGERNGKPTIAALGLPFAFVTESQLMPVLDAIVSVHQEWGDRQNRTSARLKYVIKRMGVPWFRERVQELVAFELQLPQENHDSGARQLHHGWTYQPSDGLWTYGAFIENGRIVDSVENGALKTALRELTTKYDAELTFTANQDVLLNGIADSDKQILENDLRSYGYGLRNGEAHSRLRMQSGACVGRITCRLAYTDSETFEPLLLDQLERLGWKDIDTSIGVTGCERQCFRPATKAIGLVGSGSNMYQLKLMGTEDGRNQGGSLTDDQGTTYLRYIPREKVVVVIDALFRIYMQEREGEEELGYFHRRIGLSAVIDNLKRCPETATLMTQLQPTAVSNLSSVSPTAPSQSN